MLIIGYHDTLQPDPPTGTVPAPPQMDALLSLRMAEARSEFDRRLPAEQRIFNGEPIPIDNLLAALQRRLQDILTLPLAESLVNGYSGPTSQQLQHAYPALAPLLRQSVSEWISATVTFIRRLQQDSSRLAQWLGLPSLPPIASLHGTTSDMHPGGHLTLRIHFRNGPCIYYKPRPVTGEWLWHALLQAIASADPSLRLPAARALPGYCPDRYGWMESVLPHPSLPSAQNTPSYWHNAGAMLCLASHVSLTDLHMGNVIATPSGPAVTDAECLGTPRLHNHPIRNKETGFNEFDITLQSMFATGLLPGRNSDDFPDVSGLFASAENVPGLHLPSWSHNEECLSRLTSKPAVLVDHGNLPGPATPLTVLPNLIAGYRQAAQALLQARGALLAKESSWLRLLNCTHAPRIVLRNTLTYALLLSQSLHPLHLHSLQSRRHALRDMLRQIAETRLPPSVLRAETHALLHLHIPRLVLLPGTRTLARSSESPLVRQFVSHSAAQEVTTRIDYLSAKNLEDIHISALISAALTRFQHA